MVIDRVALVSFRNYGELSASFCDGVNVITGRNAQGKTNLIEAVFYIASGRSFRARSDRELVRFGDTRASIRADITSGGRAQCLEAFLEYGRRRRLIANGAPLRSAAELSGKLSAVLFCPGDLDIVRDGAAGRRRLMDTCLCQLRPRYAAALREFNRLYDHKTAILRNHGEKPRLLDALDDFNVRLAQCSAQLIWFRAAFTATLAEKAAAVHREFSGGVEELQISYKTVSTITDARRGPEELLTAILEHQRAHRQAEIDSGQCLTGAHKDDLEIGINGAAARAYASQGQARTAALSLKLAEREIHFDDRGEYPVLLLDDVLSELDAERAGFVLNKIKNGQVLITCCEYDGAAASAEGTVVRVEGGEIVR
ncbi:MAG: DNA replication/repair protein RecF [Oscillospiraceae bacterium]|jgi:DNA replication and repair protein RecF|nr:DNA replication/repair protein RecF [Oscillospiraceae bacterium]